MATISYFWLVNSIHPPLGKIVEVLGNWLPPQNLFDYNYFLCAVGLCLAILYGNLIIEHLD